MESSACTSGLGEAQRRSGAGPGKGWKTRRGRQDAGRNWPRNTVLSLMPLLPVCLCVSACAAHPCTISAAIRHRTSRLAPLAPMQKPILKSKAGTEGGGLAQPVRPRRPVLFQDPGAAAGSPGSLSAPAQHLSYRHLEEEDGEDRDDEEGQGARATASARAAVIAAAARNPGGASTSGATWLRHPDGADRGSGTAAANGRSRGPHGTPRFQTDGAGSGHSGDSDAGAAGGGEVHRLGGSRGPSRAASSTTGRGKKAPRPATGYRYHASPRQQEQGHGHHANHTAGPTHHHNHHNQNPAHAHGLGHGGTAATAVAAPSADATWGHVARSAAPKPVLRLRQGSYTSMGSVHSFVGSPGSLAAAARPAAHRAGAVVAAEASADSGSTPGLWDTDSEPASESELIVEGPTERASMSGQPHHHAVGGRGSSSGVGAVAGLGPPLPAFRRSSHCGGALAAVAPAPGAALGAGMGGADAPMVSKGAAGRGALHASVGEWKQGVRQWKHNAGYDAQQLQPLPPPVPKPILQNRRSAPGNVGGGNGGAGAGGGGGGGGGGYQHSRLQQQRAARKLRFEVPGGGGPPGVADDEDDAMDPRVAAAAAARSKAGARVGTPAANPAAKTGWRGAWRRITAALGRRPSTPAPKDLMRRAAEKAAAGAAGGWESDGGEEDEWDQQEVQERVEVQPAAAAAAAGAARRPPTGKPASKRGAGRSVGFAVSDGAGQGDGAAGPGGSWRGDGEDEEGGAVELTEQSAIMRRPRAMDSRVAHRKRMAHNVGRQPSLYVAADRAIRFQIPDSSDDSDGLEGEDGDEDEDGDGHREDGGDREGARRGGGIALAGAVGAARGGRSQHGAGKPTAAMKEDDNEQEEDEGGNVGAAVGLRDRGGQEGWRRQSASGLMAEGSASPRSARLSSAGGVPSSSRGSKRNSHSSSGAPGGLDVDEDDGPGALASTTSPRSPGSLLAAVGTGLQTSPSGAASASEAGGSGRPRVAFSLRGGGGNAVAPAMPGTREQSPVGSNGGAGPSSASAATSPMQYASPVAGGGGVGRAPRRTVTLSSMSSAGSAVPALSSPAPPPGPPPAPPPGEPMGPRRLRRNLTNVSEASRRDGPSPSVSISGAAPPSAPPSRYVSVSVSGSGFGSGAGAAAAAAAVAAAPAASPSPALTGVPALHLHPASSVSSHASSAHGAHASSHYPSASTPSRAQLGPTSRLSAETSASALPGGSRHVDQHPHSLSRSLPHSRSIAMGALGGGGHEPQPGSPGDSGSFVGSDAGENSGRWRTVFNKIKSAISGGGGSSRDSSPGRGGSPAGSGRNTPRRSSVASMSDSGRVAPVAAADVLGADGGGAGGDASGPPTPTAAAAAARHRAMDSRISHRKRMALERKPSLVLAASRALAEEAEEEEEEDEAAADAGGPGGGGNVGGAGSRVDRVVRFEELVAHRKSAPGTLYASGGDRWLADGRDGGGGGGSEGGTSATAAGYAGQQQYRHSTGAVPAATSGRSSGGGAGANTSGGGSAPAPPPSDGERRSSRGGFLTRLRDSLSGKSSNA